MKKNEIGNRYGILTVIEEAGKRHNRFQWLCMCDCGSTVVVDGNHLRTGHTTSCGCRKNIRHGGCYTPEYNVWCDMLSRCNNPNDVAYYNYGGRGIKVCKRWRKFENFIADMGERPTRKHTLDRINNNKGYSSSNCRWATMKQQSRNRRNNHLITYRDKTLCVTDWAKELSINPNTLFNRLHRGWSEERTLSTGVMG